MAQGGGRDDEGPDYGWLYGGGEDEDTRPGPRSDPDPTQMIRMTPRSGGGRRPADDDATRVAPTSQRERRPASAPPPPPPSARPSPTPRGPGRPRRSPRRVLVLVLLAWLVFLLAVPVWAFVRIENVDATPTDERPESQPGNTYLIVGSDSRGDLSRAERRRLGTGPEDVGQRTDTILLLHTGSGPNLLMSIPRDSLVDVPGYGVTKVNASYAYGGAPLLVETVEQDTGIRIDDYVEIGFLGLVNIVDAVGGITVCPEEKIVDPLAKLKIGKGCHEINGRKALGYARSRKTSTLGDIDRAAHQREVVSAIGSKVTSPWTVLNPWRYFSTAKAGSEAVAVSDGTGPFTLARFGLAMTRVDGESGLTCGVPISDLEVNWDPQRSQRMFRLIRQDRTADIGKKLCSPSGLR